MHLWLHYTRRRHADKVRARTAASRLLRTDAKLLRDSLEALGEAVGRARSRKRFARSSHARRRRWAVGKWFEAAADGRRLRQSARVVWRQHCARVLRGCLMSWVEVAACKHFVRTVVMQGEARRMRVWVMAWAEVRVELAGVRRKEWSALASQGFEALWHHWLWERQAARGLRVVERRRMFAVLERWRTAARCSMATDAAVARHLRRKRLYLLLGTWHGLARWRCGVRCLCTGRAVRWEGEGSGAEAHGGEGLRAVVWTDKEAVGRLVGRRVRRVLFTSFALLSLACTQQRRLRRKLSDLSAARDFWALAASLRGWACVVFSSSRYP